MKGVCMMKWYEPLIWDEFLSYFSDESVSYLKIVNGERVVDQMLVNYREVVWGLTTGDNSIRLKYEADFIAVSKTIFYDLITGVRSIDDWDSVISDLNAAGMQDLKDVYQARADRFFAAYNS